MLYTVSREFGSTVIRAYYDSIEGQVYLNAVDVRQAVGNPCYILATSVTTLRENDGSSFEAVPLLWLYGEGSSSWHRGGRTIPFIKWVKETDFPSLLKALLPVVPEKPPETAIIETLTRIEKRLDKVDRYVTTILGMLGDPHGRFRC